MKVRGDIERINLRTGERFQRVTGNGESRLEPVGKSLKKVVDKTLRFCQGRNMH